MTNSVGSKPRHVIGCRWMILWLMNLDDVAQYLPENCLLDSPGGTVGGGRGSCVTACLEEINVASWLALGQRPNCLPGWPNSMHNFVSLFILIL